MTMTITRPVATETDRVLADMLTENTGRSMLDSGDAYGRSWERNAGRAVDDFLAAEPVYIRHGEFVVLDVFHWLRDRLDFDPRLDAIYRRWVDIRDASEDGHYGYLEDMEDFARLVDDHFDTGHYVEGTFNSYNHEDCLSQTIQFTLFTDHDGRFGGDTFCLLQIHGGCDVRGGYTAPRVFRVMDYDGGSSMLDFDAFTMSCSDEEHAHDTALPGMPEREPHVLDHRSGELVTYGGSCTTMRDTWGEDYWETWIQEDEETGEHFIRCPFGHDNPTPMALYPYPCG